MSDLRGINATIRVRSRSFQAEPFIGKAELVSLSLLVVPPATDSVRLTGENCEHVRMLAECAKEFPPIVVHRQTGRVVDGLHRLSAAAMRGDEAIRVVYVDGSLPEVFALSVKLNMRHGLPLSQADRVAAATRIVLDQPHLSDRAIATSTMLSPKTVAAARRRASKAIPQLNSRVGLDGRTRPVRATEGRRRAAGFLAENPDATLRQIAAAAEIALGTARDVRERIRHGKDPVPESTPTPRERNTSRRGGSTTPEVPAPDLALIRNDPSLRFTEVGRKLLHLVDVYSSVPLDLEKLLEQVPVHCSVPFAEMAKQWSDSWSEIGQRLEKRANITHR